ncbi:hypothetical protein E1288_42325, partial [Saccharopolyspora elongata]
MTTRNVPKRHRTARTGKPQEEPTQTAAVQRSAARPKPTHSSSGGPGESHPRAPTERSVTVSRHSALLIAIRRTCAPIASER